MNKDFCMVNVGDRNVERATVWLAGGNRAADWRSDSRPVGRRRFRPIARRYQWQSNSLEWFIVTQQAARRRPSYNCRDISRRRRRHPRLVAI